MQTSYYLILLKNLLRVESLKIHIPKYCYKQFYKLIYMYYYANVRQEKPVTIRPNDKPPQTVCLDVD